MERQVFGRQPTDIDGPVPLANLLDTFMREVDEKRTAVDGIQRLFDGMRSYLAPAEEDGSVTKLDELSALTRGVVIPLGSDNGTFHVNAVIGGGADGVVFHGSLQDKKTGVSTEVAAKFSYPFERVRLHTKHTVELTEDGIEAAAMQFVAVTEQAVHDRLQKVGFSAVPNLFMSTLLNSVDDTNDAMALTIMEHIHGKELNQLAIEIGKGVAPFSTLRPILEGMVMVLSQLQERGIYVWDANSRNVLIREGTQENPEQQVVLIDFRRANITGKVEFYRERGLGSHPEIPENSGETPTQMEQTVVNGLGEAWLDVAKRIKSSGKVAHAEASLLESLAYVLRDEKVTSLGDVPALIERIFQQA